jgi:hypothetical protein
MRHNRTEGAGDPGRIRLESQSGLKALATGRLQSADYLQIAKAIRERIEMSGELPPEWCFVAALQNAES